MGIITKLPLLVVEVVTPVFVVVVVVVVVEGEETAGVMGAVVVVAGGTWLVLVLVLVVVVELVEGTGRRHGVLRIGRRSENTRSWAKHCQILSKKVLERKFLIGI